MGLGFARARTHVALVVAFITIALVGFAGAEATHSQTNAEAARLRDPGEIRRQPLVDSGARQIVMRPPFDLRHRSIGLTCGYHESCKRMPWRTPPYLSGKAIDWDDNNATIPNSRAVFFTASADAQTTAAIAYISFTFHAAGTAAGYPCHTLIATVRDISSHRPLFSMVYQHVKPVRGLKQYVIHGNGQAPVALSRANLTPATSRPNVVLRIGTMADDPCPFYSRDAAGAPLYHAHVGPGASARGVRLSMNVEHSSTGLRAIPEANGCGPACTASYPGPRWRWPYWQLWTYAWQWRVSVPGGRLI